MKKRVVSFIAMIVLVFNLSGCFNYIEINKVTFATSVIFDEDELGNVILYLDCVRPYRNAGDSSDKGRRVIFKGKGKSSLEALRDIDSASSNKLDLSQVRAYIFTEKCARAGIKKYIDVINNDQKFSFKPYLFVYFGEVDPLLELTNGDEEYLGIYLDELVNKNKRNGKVIAENINEYIKDSLETSKISFMSSIRIKENAVNQDVELDGGVIMKDNHLIDVLDRNDVYYYNLLNNKVTEGTLQVTNPDEKNKFVTLDILEHYIKTNINIDNGKINVDKNITLKVSIGEIQGKLEVNDTILSTIKINEEEKLKIALKNFYSKYEEKGIDILDIKRKVEQKYPKNEIEDILGNVNLNLNIDLLIDGSSLVKDRL